MPDRTTRIRSGQLKDDDIKPVDLAATNSPVEGYKVAYDSATQEFKWQEDVSSLFEIDMEGNLIPVTGSLTDSNFELNGSDDIVPKA
jgi:hypothetical protein